MKPPRNWRTIVVDDQKYLWKIKLVDELFQKSVFVRSSQDLASQCVIAFDRSTMQPIPITPKLVAYCIHYAIEIGWKPMDTKQDFHINNGNDLWLQLATQE